MDERIWQKFCTSCSGSCVEWATNADGTIATRNSADPDGPVTTYTEHELDEFAKGWLAR